MLHKMLKQCSLIKQMSSNNILELAFMASL